MPSDLAALRELQDDIARLGENLAGEVKGAVKVMQDKYGEAEGRINAIEEEQRTQQHGFQKMSEEIVRMNDDSMQRSHKIALQGECWSGIGPLSKSGDANEVLTTFGPDGGTRGKYARVQETNDMAYMAYRMWAGSAAMDPGSGGWPIFRREYERARALHIDALKGAGMTKALDTVDTSIWIPTGMSADLYGRFVLELRAFSNVPTFDMPRGVGSFDWPIITTGATAYIIGESTADYTGTSNPTVIPSEMGRAKRTFTTKVLGVRQDVSRELTEDAIVAVAPTINQDNVLAHAEAVENWFLNGDVSTTHQDADVTLSYDQQKAFDGIRISALAAAKYDNGAVAFDDTSVLAFLKALGKWAINPRKMGLIPGVPAYWQMVAFDKVKTLQNYGAQATLLRGELANFAGIPVIPSEKIRAVNASGVVDTTASNNTKTLVIGCKFDEAKLGMKRGIELETVYLPLNQMIAVIATTRYAFNFMRPTSTAGNTFIGYMYDITA